MIGRRGFLKGLSSLIAGLTVAGKLKEQEKKLANTYIRKYRNTSLPSTTSKVVYPSGIFESGYCCITGIYTCSGRYDSFP